MTAPTYPVVAFVAALAPIAREVGVTLPPVAGWQARLAAVDGIDVGALDVDAARLRTLADRVSAATATVGDVADGLPDAWLGVAGRRAHTAVGDVHDQCDEAAQRLRTAATASAAASRGVSDLRAALHATLAAVPVLVLAGRAIADLTPLDLVGNRALIAAMLQAAVATVETAMGVTETAVAEVLTVLADSTLRLADPLPPALGDRTDVVHERRGSVDAAEVVGALAGAAVATAAAVGAAAAGAASVVAQVVDAAFDDAPSPDAPRPTAPEPSTPADPHEPARQPDSATSAATATGGSDGPPVATPPQRLNLRVDDDPTPPPVTEAPPAPVDDSSAAVDDSPAPDNDRPAPAVDRPDVPTVREEHDAPAVAARQGPPATPDPGDGGGLALAGDR
ncbi:MAG: hypothetical protein PGN29_18385 [Gordonia paraffinivorans]